MSASAAYTDAKTKGNICNQSIVVDPDPNCGGPGDAISIPSGTRLPITPKFKATGTARYTWPVWTGKAHVQGSVAYQGSASADIRRDMGGGINPNSYLGRLHSFALVDLFAGYDWDKYSAELFVSNLFDKRAELSRFVSCSICTRTYIFPSEPRTIGVRLGARF